MWRENTVPELLGVRKPSYARLRCARRAGATPNAINASNRNSTNRNGPETFRATFNRQRTCAHFKVHFFEFLRLKCTVLCGVIVQRDGSHERCSCLDTAQVKRKKRFCNFVICVCYDGV